MPQNVFKFDKNTFEEFKISRVSLHERGREDWVAFMWSKNGQEAIGRGTTILEALTSAVEYLTQSFRLPPSMLQKSGNTQEPSRIRRNTNNRLRSPAEQILERFSLKKEDEKSKTLEAQDEKVILEARAVASEVALPEGYAVGPDGSMKVTLSQDIFKNNALEKNADVQACLRWIQTVATQIRERAPLQDSTPIVATAVAGSSSFEYFPVEDIDRSINTKEAFVVNFATTDNFQVQLFDLNMLQEYGLWKRIDLQD